MDLAPLAPLSAVGLGLALAGGVLLGVARAVVARPGRVLAVLGAPVLLGLGVWALVSPAGLALAFRLHVMVLLTLAGLAAVRCAAHARTAASLRARSVLGARSTTAPARPVALRALGHGAAAAALCALGALVLARAP